MKFSDYLITEIFRIKNENNIGKIQYDTTNKELNKRLKQLKN